MSKKLAQNKHQYTPGRRGKMTRKLWEQILSDLETTGNLEASCAYNGIHPSTAHKYIRENEDWAEEYEIARQKACRTLELEAYRRAVQGTPQEVYYQGECVGTTTVYSDRLLELLLKSQRPDKYSNKAQISVEHTHELSGSAKDKLQSLLGLTDKSNDGEIIDAEYTEEGDEN